MKIEFRNADGGDLLLEKDSEELKDILSSITREGVSINLVFDKDNFFKGYVDEILYNHVADEEDSLYIYVTEEYYDAIFEVRKKLDEINDNIMNIE